MSSTQLVTITITGTNDAPTVSAAIIGGGEDTTFALDLLQDASDVDHGAVLHVENVVWDEATSPGGLPTGFTPNGGSPAVNVGAGAYQGLTLGQSAVAHFTYHVVEDQGARAVQHAAVTIEGKREAPVAQDDSFPVIELATPVGSCPLGRLSRPGAVVGECERASPVLLQRSTRVGHHARRPRQHSDIPRFSSRGVRPGGRRCPACRLRWRLKRGRFRA
jgi:hypothetical protein